MSAVYDISVTKGDRWVQKFRFRTSAAGVVPVTYLNVATGYTGLCQIRATSASPTVICNGVVTFGTDSTGPWCQVEFIQTETPNIVQGSVWDLQLTNAVGPFTYLRGNVEVIADVSRVGA